MIERLIMWTFSQWTLMLGEVSLTMLQVFSLSYALYSLQKFVNNAFTERPSVGIIRNGESMCDSCKKKDTGQKRIFKHCHHTYCERCFLRQCVELCLCVHCAVAHFQCRLCNKSLRK